MASSPRKMRAIAPLLLRSRPRCLAATHQYTRWLQPMAASRPTRLYSTIDPQTAPEPSRIQSNEAPISETTSDPPSNHDDTTPWYLQASTHPTPTPQSPLDAEPSPSPQDKRYTIPPLPLSPPPLLSPLLTNLSSEQGLSDLTILDLRRLDPPPALGSNLVMLLGTARSEKHVHVSADRVCRFLSNLDSALRYGASERPEDSSGSGSGGGSGSSSAAIKPVADGLLGRNELRLKLKRKAKRNRIMSSGGQGPGYLVKDERGEVDDGIRTGWVCVNVGKVRGGELEDVVGTVEKDGFVGFNEDQGGCRIVVQIMTEEKRGQLQLEELWQGMLNKQQRQVDEQRLQQEFAA